ncbi:ComEC/Rec2 family competence protein [uncultured Nocardioides sp.]|uniref:ComEC/Rec2 family competence protein n=1 Tax=uncultured Nocardioides sp. TaxID=198441 RepID=UPI002626E431|nr:ComEC/Rec2 family competence protein [uncultured Nocardioides sp.]
MPAATRPADLRMGLVGLAAWAGGLLVAAPGRLLGAGAVLLLVVLLLMWGALVTTRALRRGRRRSWTSLPAWRTTALACLLAMLAVLVAGLVRADRVAGDPVASLATEGAAVTGRLVVSTDPRPMAGARTDGVFLRAVVVEVSGRGTTWRVRSPVLVLAPASWSDVRLGSTVALAGRLRPTDDGDRALAAMLSVHGEPVVLEQPGAWWRATEVLRASLRAAVAHRPAPERVLVPALVAGDDAGLDPRVAEEFRATGLTHLLAVSGTNLTLLLGALLVLARLVGVRGRGLLVLGLAGVVGFVLLARTEPSVLRAAVMGVVGLLALTHGGGRAVRGLGVAVTVLLLVDPTLATAPGFALSVLATGGIVLLGPRWRDALARWLPRWLAEAIAVPTAAQLACTPVVAALSGQVSLVAVVANLLAAPAVGPATVLGLLGGCVGLVWPWAGRVLGTVATWCVGWIVEVAHRGAGLPTAAVDWSTSGAALVALTALTVVLAWRGPRLVSTRARGAASCVVLVVAVLVRPPVPGWPPDGWVLVACDVGQGDALVLATTPGHAVVVDVGPEPGAVGRCLDDLGVGTVDLLVLTHFHADHVDGLSAVLGSHDVGEVWVSRVLDPADGARSVLADAAAAGVPLHPAPYAGTWRSGATRLQVLWPTPGEPDTGPGDGTAANDMSVVLLVEVAGLRLLLTGDLEPPGQAALARTLPDLAVDVLKVPHHGSSYQDLGWLTGLGARVAVVTVGEDNDYGHPATSVLTALESAGARVLRTDTDGSVAVVAGEAGPSVLTTR